MSKFLTNWVADALPTDERETLSQSINEKIKPQLEVCTDAEATDTILSSILDAACGYSTSIKAQTQASSITELKRSVKQMHSGLVSLKKASDKMCKVTNGHVVPDINFVKLMRNEPCLSFAQDALGLLASQGEDVSAAIVRLQTKLDSMETKTGPNKDEARILAALIAKALRDNGLPATTTRNPDTGRTTLFSKILYDVFEILGIRQSADDCIKNVKRIDMDSSQNGVTILVNEKR
ncbi:hypothetical protein PN836_017600 [Ningiella sp. W23]|uniref:hypothetical protein n=1 Tax=Ningiella sp. W23 TaxID=3023715 RepID=UPI0037577372